MRTYLSVGIFRLVNPTDRSLAYYPATVPVASGRL
jgi:hypothetical protein